VNTLKRVWTAGTLAALVLTLAACGDAPSTAAGSVSTPAQTAAAPTAIAEVATPEPAAVAPEPVVQVDQAPPAQSDDSAPCAVGQVKGNDTTHIFHVPGGQSYARTHANVTCFDTAAEAIAAGYRAAKK
jgi:hypothetical protein